MKNNLPFFTIITPTYNRKELLEKAILSVINQKKDSPFEWEHIIVDDGSKDGTYEYIKNYLKQYPSIKYIYQENQGVGKARNVGIENMSKNSDYVIFLDSDDELKHDLISFCIKKFDEQKKQGEYEQILGIYLLYENEKGEIIGNKDMIVDKLYFTYENFLRLDIKVDMILILKSKIFIYEPYLRFPEDIITESVMWAKMWQFTYKNGLKLVLYNHVGAVCRIFHTSETKITKTISIDRFRKNAIGNERILGIIGDDLLKYGYKKSYSEYLFRAGINRILCHEKKRGIQFILNSLKYEFDIKKFIIVIISIISRNFLLFVYKLYI